MLLLLEATLARMIMHMIKMTSSIGLCLFACAGSGHLYHHTNELLK